VAGGFIGSKGNVIKAASGESQPSPKWSTLYTIFQSK
jgi:hypothetical protein